MVFSYDVSKASGQVRLTVGDTDSCDPKLQDAEILYFLTLTGQDVTLASAKAARAIAALYSRQVDTRVESVSTSNSQAAAQYLALAARLEAEAASGNGTAGAAGAFSAPYVGGTSVADMNSRTDNTDRVQPDFVKGQFDDPAGSNQLARDILAE